MGGMIMDQCTLNSSIAIFCMELSFGLLWARHSLHSHILRHAFATEMASMKVSVDVIAALLHQRDTSSRSTIPSLLERRMEAAEMVFVDRSTLAAEALRSPVEIGRMLNEAEGSGRSHRGHRGNVRIANLCQLSRLHWVCWQCARPEKRYQIDRRWRGPRNMRCGPPAKSCFQRNDA